MALASKDRNPNLLHHQPYTFYSTKSCGDYEIGGDGISEKMDKNVAAGGSSNSSNSLSCSPSNGTNSLVYQAAKNYHHQPKESHSLISFKPGYINEFAQTSSTGCLLSFEENNEHPYSILDHMSQMRKANSSIDDNIGLLDNLMNSSVQTASSAVNYGLITSHGSIEDGDLELDSFGWANPQAHDHRHHNNIQQVLGAPESPVHNRPHTGSESEQVYKKQCTTNSNGSTKKAKPKSTQSKDPQSIAAKNRRERISERLKVLQDLVPNGSKVDLVTMLEKAIGYVKFLQLQVKVLATDEFWPMQGGKPPELSQVREAIDAIISSSQIDRNSSSK